MLPPVYVILMILGMALAHKYLPKILLVPKPLSYVGWVFIVAALGVVVWVNVLFRKAKTSIHPREIPSDLVTTGPFRVTRNPIYVAMTLGLFGVAFLLGSLFTFLFPLLFVAIIDRLFIPVEEKNLEKSIGAPYTQYKKKVRRWI